MACGPTSLHNLNTTTPGHNTTLAPLSPPHEVAATSTHTLTHTQINPNRHANLATEIAPQLTHPHTELTESDNELLAATEAHNVTEHKTTTTDKSSTWSEHHHHHHVFLPCETPSNTPPPSSLSHHMLIEANMLNFDQWLLRAIPQYHTHYPQHPPISCSQEISSISHYLKDIADMSTLTTDAPPNMWLLYATEHITDALLLKIIRKRAAEYQPYVWNDKHHAKMAREEATEMGKYLNQYDSMWQELHEHSTDL